MSTTNIFVLIVAIAAVIAAVGIIAVASRRKDSEGAVTQGELDRKATKADRAKKKAVQQVERAITELGVGIRVKAVHDEETIASYGLTQGQCPAVIAVQHRLKSVGYIPEVAAIKEWVKRLR